MSLTGEQLRFYADNGYLFFPDYFSNSEIALIKNEVPALFQEDTPRRVVEKNGDVRSVYGSHVTNETLRQLSRHPKIVEPAMQITDDEVYIYQFKINAKIAFSGDLWEWHQDYVFWLKEDGMPSTRVVNVVIFLDEVNEFNAPLFLIPGSHKEGVIDVNAHEESNGNGDDAPWLSNLTADLKYSLGKSTIARLVRQYGITAPKGMPGSVLFFDSNVVHASGINISPFDRTLLLVTYNSVRNAPPITENSRPHFLVSRDTEPIALEADLVFAS
ncbi:MAG TPA: phytanoyl-CoA dioxygenase family protein [Pyrinomonadaceae bacterium]|jgi:L-proline 4-hydroxylase|nr:phytanoyl-CoA dioxygenase family protein [Pyrinomonadaceae bacterium]